MKTEDPSNARQLIIQCLESRRPGTTICPSEIARALADGDGWRTAMPVVHAAVDALKAEGRLRLSWKGKALERRAGPYRIGRVEADD